MQHKMFISKQQHKKYEDELNQEYNDVVDLILCPNHGASTMTKFNQRIRPSIYYIYITGINASVIITKLADLLLIKEIDCSLIGDKIMQLVSEAKFNLNLNNGKSEIQIISHFIIKTMKIFR